MHSAEPPLVICGDGNGGKDCMLFLGRAQSADIHHVIARHNPLANSLSDAESLALVLLNDKLLKNVLSVHLVTDSWHMRRAALFLRHVLCNVLSRRLIEVYEYPIESALPPRLILDREEQGIADFFAGCYKPKPSVVTPSTFAISPT